MNQELQGQIDVRDASLAIMECKRVRPIAVEALADFRLWLRYADGVEGVVDLSDLAQMPVFRGWHEGVPFESVKLGETGIIVWNDRMDLCPDALYLELTGKTPEDLFPVLQN